jgi:hypothetical protein
MIDEIRDQIYEEAFEAALRMIERRRMVEPGFSIEDLERLLQTEYVVEGNDQFGRGEVFEIELAATIAAHEVVLEKWRREIQSRSKAEENS